MVPTFLHLLTVTTLPSRMARKRQKVTRSNVDYALLLAQDGACWSSDVTTNFSASTLKSIKFM
jgi:hypothetical protein